MTESTSHLTATQAAARLGVKPATLYAYVSRGLVDRQTSADGRRSLFDPDDIARLARRRAGHRTPSDVTVASELTLVDAPNGRLWFRGLDAMRLCQQRTFEEVAWFLWTGQLTRQRWLAVRTADAPESGVALPLVAAAMAERRGDLKTPDEAAELMAALIDGLGATTQATGIAAVLAEKMCGRAADRATVRTISTALSLNCEHGMTAATLAARLAAASGGGLAHALTAAMAVAASEVRALTEVEVALSAGSPIGDLDAGTISAVFPKEPYRSSDPRAGVVFEMLGEGTSTAQRPRGAGPASATFALVAVARSCGMPVGSAATLLLIARSAGWIAHALEEGRQPTPYRPRLAYTGPAPRPPAPRALDAVRGYLSDD